MQPINAQQKKKKAKANVVMLCLGIVQLESAGLACTTAPGSSPVLNKLGVLVHSCNLSTKEGEVGGQELKAILSYREC